MALLLHGSAAAPFRWVRASIENFRQANAGSSPGGDSSGGGLRQAAGISVRFLHPGRMAMNLIDAMVKSVGGDALKQLGGLIGEGENQTKSAVSAALPTLLAALAGL